MRRYLNKLFILIFYLKFAMRLRRFRLINCVILFQNPKFLTRRHVIMRQNAPKYLLNNDVPIVQKHVVLLSNTTKMFRDKWKRSGSLLHKKNAFAFFYFEIIEFWNYLPCTCMYEYTRGYIFRILPTVITVKYLITNRKRSLLLLWLIDYWLTTNEQFFSYIFVLHRKNMLHSIKW